MTNLDDFKNYLKIHVDAENSQKRYFHTLKKFFEYYKEFNQENVNGYLAYLIEHQSKSAFNVALASFNHYSKYSKIKVELPKYKNPGKKIKEYITEEEMYYIISYFSRMFKRHEYYSFIIKLLFYTGLRPSELVNLKREKVFLNNNYFIATDTKDKDDRKVPFPKQLKTEIEKYLQEPEKKNAFKISKPIMKHIMKKVNEMLNFKRLNIKSFRHSYAHFMLSKGVSVEKLQLLMGHSNLSTTMIYAQPNESEAINAYNNLITINTKFKKI